MRIGVMNGVEPMPGPALTVPRRSQQTIDDRGKGVGRFVVEERAYFLGCGRQAGQIEGDAPQEIALVRALRRMHPFAFELGQNEKVDRRFLPSLGFCWWNSVFAERLQRPDFFFRTGCHWIFASNG